VGLAMRISGAQHFRVALVESNSVDALGVGDAFAGDGGGWRVGLARIGERDRDLARCERADIIAAVHQHMPAIVVAFDGGKEIAAVVEPAPLASIISIHAVTHGHGTASPSSQLRCLALRSM
jgi:hypothetical protein